MSALDWDFETFRRTSIRRSEEGFGAKFSAPYPQSWSLADWMTALVGELGELANKLKKRRRGEDIDQREIEDEWADTFTYLLLMAEALGIDDPLAVVWSKFDRVSARIGWKP